MTTKPEKIDEHNGQLLNPLAEPEREQGKESEVGALMTFEEYARMEERGEVHVPPYEYEEGSEAGKRVVYFAAVHSNDPSHAMFDEGQIERSLEKARPDVVFVEGLITLTEHKDAFLKRLAQMSREEAIRAFGEAGFAAKIAQEQGAEVDSPEPAPKEEIEDLQKRGFSRNAIFAFFTYRQIPEFQRRANESDMNSFKEYIKPTLEEFKKATQWADFDYSFERALYVGKKIWGDDMNPADESWEFRLDPVSRASQTEHETVVNEIARESNVFRDTHILEKVKETLQGRDRIFIVYGATHAVMQRPAIREMLSLRS